MRKTLRTLGGVAGLALLGLALFDQLARDPRYRDWHGNVFGVPYDFRLPDADKLKAKVWAPEDPRIFTPHVFGVGWAINAGRIVRLLNSRLQQA